MNLKELMELDRWQRLRQIVYERDRSRCVICGNPGLDTHHWTYAWGYFNPATVSLLCRPCHLVWQGCDPSHLPEDHPLKPHLVEIATLARYLGRGTFFPTPVADCVGD
jgi:hypothetical protein